MWQYSKPRLVTSNRSRLECRLNGKLDGMASRPTIVRSEYPGQMKHISVEQTALIYLFGSHTCQWKKDKGGNTTKGRKRKSPNSSIKIRRAAIKPKLEGMESASLGNWRRIRALLYSLKVPGNTFSGLSRFFRLGLGEKKNNRTNRADSVYGCWRPVTNQ